MDDVITRAEHEEFKKRIEDENHRQNKRIEVLEKITQQINSLTVSVEKLAQSIELMVSEQKQQGKRLETLESRDCPRSCSWCSGNEIWIEIKETNYEH